MLALGPRLGDRARRVGRRLGRPAARVRTATRSPPSVAAADVVALDELAAFDGPGLEAWFGAAGDDEEEGVLALTVASAGPNVELSRLLPILESLGLWVVDELSWDLGRPRHPPAGRPAVRLGRPRRAGRRAAWPTPWSRCGRGGPTPIP